MKNQTQSSALDMLNVATSNQSNQVIKLLEEQSDARLPSNNNSTEMARVNTDEKYLSTECWEESVPLVIFSLKTN